MDPILISRSVNAVHIFRLTMIQIAITILGDDKDGRDLIAKHADVGGTMSLPTRLAKLRQTGTQ